MDIIAALCNLNAMPKCQIPLLKCQAADPDGVDQSTLSGNRKSFRCFGPKDGVSLAPADEFDDFAHSFGVSFFVFPGDELFYCEILAIQAKVPVASRCLQTAISRSVRGHFFADPKNNLRKYAF